MYDIELTLFSIGGNEKERKRKRRLETSQKKFCLFDFCYKYHKQINKEKKNKKSIHLMYKLYIGLYYVSVFCNNAYDCIYIYIVFC